MILNFVPWVELSIGLPIVGGLFVQQNRNLHSSLRWCLAFSSAAVLCAVLASVNVASEQAKSDVTGAAEILGQQSLGWSQTGKLGSTLFGVDEVTAPMLPLIALVHFFTALATARTKMSRFSFTGLLYGQGVRSAAVAALHPGPLLLLLAFEAWMPLAELQRRGQPIRLFSLHAGGFTILLVLSWYFGVVLNQPVWAGGWVLAAVLWRTGLVPFHLWFAEVFASGSFGSSLLFCTPILAVYPAARLALPFAEVWMLETFGTLAIITALYAAGLGLVQTDARRYFVSLYLSHASLVLVGLGLNTPFAVAGGLVMWMTAGLSLVGLGLTLRSVEARIGSLSLQQYRGLYQSSPMLAAAFLFTGLSVVGFPGTAGFIAAELVVGEAVGAHLGYGMVVVLIAALNGIGVVRVYLLLFTGCKRTIGVDLGVTGKERTTLLAVIALIVGGALFPQPYLESRRRAAELILKVEPSATPSPDAGTPHTGIGWGANGIGIAQVADPTIASPTTMRATNKR